MKHKGTRLPQMDMKTNNDHFNVTNSVHKLTNQSIRKWGKIKINIWKSKMSVCFGATSLDGKKWRENFRKT